MRTKVVDKSTRIKCLGHDDGRELQSQSLDVALADTEEVREDNQDISFVAKRAWHNTSGAATDM